MCTGPILQFPETARVFLSTDGNCPQVGQALVQADLAETLRTVSHGGPDAFYRGSLSGAIAEEIQSHGGILGKRDLAEFRPALEPPISGAYWEFEILSVGPPSAGGVSIVEVLNILEGFDLKKLGFASSALVDILVKAMDVAFRDRCEYLGDARFVEVPWESGGTCSDDSPPTIVMKDGEPLMAVGAAGGARIVTSVVQAILNVLDFRMGMKQALCAPRVHCQGKEVEVESGIPYDVVASLRKMGHDVTLIGEGGMLCWVHALKYEDGGIVGAADPRHGGLAVGYTRSDGKSRRVGDGYMWGILDDPPGD